MENRFRDRVAAHTREVVTEIENTDAVEHSVLLVRGQVLKGSELFRSDVSCSSTETSLKQMIVGALDFAKEQGILVEVLLMFMEKMRGDDDIMNAVKEVLNGEKDN